MSYTPAIENDKETIYLAGREDLDNSLRFTVDSDTGYTEIQSRINGVWQPADFETGPRSLWLGKSVGVAAIGNHVATERADGTLHFLGHSMFDGEASVTDAKIMRAFSFQADLEAQPDQSGEWSGTVYEYSNPVTAHTLLQKLTMKTGAVAASSPVRFQIWLGADDTGLLLFDQSYPTDVFAALSDAALILDGHMEYEEGTTVFSRFSSDNTFSLKTNAAVTFPYYKIDISSLTEDNLLQTQEWVDGATWTQGEYFIDNRMIYVCNVTGAQTGTFAANADKWEEFGANVLHGEHWKRVGTTVSPTVTGDDVAIGDLVVTGTATIPVINNRLVVKGSESVGGQNACIEINNTAPGGDRWFLRAGATGTPTPAGGFSIADTSSYRLFISPAGVVNAPFGLQSGGQDVLVTETDPVFSAWDKSTGIVITESQISDLDHFVTADETDPVFMAWDRSTGITITESQITDLNHFVTGDETDPVFMAWDRSTGITITEAQITDLQAYLLVETDPVFTAWDKSTGITITTAQVTDHSYFGADLQGFTVGQVAYGNSVGAGLVGSNNFTYAGGVLTVVGTVKPNLVQFPNETGPKLNMYLTTFAIGVEAGDELRIASNDVTTIYSMGYSGTEVARFEYGGWLKVVGGVRAPEIWSTGDLKVQPDVTGDIVCFGDTDVSDVSDGKKLYIYRKADEGDDYIRLFINAARRAYIHGSPVGGLYMQGQTEMGIRSVTEDVVLRVGDAAGAKKVYVKDSADVTVASIDSDGYTYIRNNILVEGPSGFDSPGETAFVFVGGTSNFIKKEQSGPLTVQSYNETEINQQTTVLARFSTDGIQLLQDVEITGLINDGVTTYTNGETQGSHHNLWNTTTAIYKQTFALATWGTGPHDSAFSPDGKKVFIVCNVDDEINEFALSTPWDVSSMTWTSTMSTTTEEANPMGVCFNLDGTKMYIVGSAGDEVNMYTLSTAWTLSTASATNLKDVSTSSTTPIGIRFKPDGLKMFISDGTLNEVQLWTLTTAWDVTTATYTTKFDASMDNIEGFSFSPDGRRLYVVDGSAEDDIHEYDLSTAWDITTGILSRSLDLTTIATVPNSITFSPDGTKMYVTDNDVGVDGILEFDMGIRVEGRIHTEQLVIGDPTQATATYTLPLEVVSADNMQANFHDSTPQELGSGGGMGFTGHHTDAADVPVLCAEIGAHKANSTSGNLDFDFVIQVQTVASGIKEILRCRAAGSTKLSGALETAQMTTTQRNALTAVNGMVIYNTTTAVFNFYEAGAWVTK